MEVKKKILISILGISAICMILNPVKSKAALQSNGNSPATKNVNDWITGVRQMQVTGGTLGLTDEINATNLTSTNKNLDIHMQKNTEYGAMAILSASAYGNQKKIADGETTTGNKSGIYIALNKEWVSAGLNDLSSTNFKNALGKYKNIYTATYVAKVGDAITETNGWHGSGASRWINNSNTGVIRAYSGSLFSYFAGAGDTSGIALNNRVYSSRAVIVVGNGF